MARNVIALENNKKHLTKAEIKARAEAEKKYKLDRSELSDVPAWLDPVARAEYERVVRETAKADMLDNLDLNVLALYADAYSRYRELQDDIAEHGAVLELVSAKGLPYRKKNPSLDALKIYSDIIFKTSAKLGLATVDRLRLTVAKQNVEKKENKFSKYK